MDGTGAIRKRLAQALIFRMDVKQGMVGARKAASRWLESNPLLGRAGLGEHATLVSDHYTKERCDFVYNHSGVNDIS